MHEVPRSARARCFSRHAMRVVAVVAALACASANERLQAGSLNLKWTDCGDSSTHGHVTGLSPTSVPLGQKSTVTGAGKIDEAVTAGSLEIDLKAAIISKTFTGKVCEPATFPLPLGTGSLTWEGLKCPVASGAVDVPVDILLAASVPPAFQNVQLTLKATAANGDKLLCMSITTSPAFDVHPARVAMIKDIQNTPDVLWKAQANDRFASQAPGASKDMCGLKANHRKELEDAISKGEIMQILEDANVEVPENFDSAENWPQCAKIIGDIRDQSNCGCCWAFAGAEAASDRMCIATNASIMLPLSAQDVCFNGEGDGCDGGFDTIPWSYIKRHGAVTGGQYKGSGPFGAGLCSDFSLPHCHHHGPQGNDPYPAEGKPGCPSQSSPRGPRTCDSSAKAPHNDFESDKYTFEGQTISASGEKAIQQAILAGGPVQTGITVYADFENYAGGIYHHVKGDMMGGHSVKIVGWGVENDVKYWKVANSWNPYWGEKGYFRMRRGNNEGGIENNVVASSPSAKWSKKSETVVV